MRRRPAVLEAAALVDGDVDQHVAPGRIRETSSLLIRVGAFALGTSTAPITRSASSTARSTSYALEAMVCR